MVIQTHLHLRALRRAVGHKNTRQQFPVGRHGIAEVETVALLADVVGQHQGLAFGSKGGKTAAVAIHAHALSDKSGVEQVYMPVVDEAAIAAVVFAAVQAGTALLFESHGVFHQLQTVLETAAALYKHNAFAVAPDKMGNAVLDNAFAYRQLVKCDGLCLQPRGKQQGGKQRQEILFHKHKGLRSVRVNV